MREGARVGGAFAAQRRGCRPDRRARRVSWCSAAALLVAGCELQEITVATPDDAVVVDALVTVRRSTPSSIEVLLRRSESGGPVEVPGAAVVVTLPDGEEIAVPQTATRIPCTQDGPPGGPGTCYRRHLPIGEGMRLELRVETDRGEVLFGSTTIPESFDLRVGPDPEGVCAHPADTPLELVWTRSEGAWAYLAETEIRGLREALEPLGIPVEEDPLHLLGLSVSASDTTIVFPGEFGVFDRGDLDRDLAVYLQGGVPPDTESHIAVTAVDRNYVNWVRGGNFNPSGLVRVPSVVGDGTGFFGSGVVSTQLVVVYPETETSTCR